MHGAAIKIISPVFGPLWVFARFTFTGLLINRKLFFRQVLILKESHAVCLSFNISNTSMILTFYKYHVIGSQLSYFPHIDNSWMLQILKWRRHQRHVVLKAAMV